jgi:hypothetical protein
MENSIKFVSGKAYWASLSAPNTTYEPVWCIDVTVDEKTKVELESIGLNVQNKGDEKGDFIKIKRKVMKPDGTEREAPNVVDSKRNPWDKSLIGNGSDVNVKFKVYEYEYNKNHGVSADLIAVQVVKLVPYGSDFDDVEGGYVVGNSPNNNNPQLAADDVPF